jgi:hypothetical protein
LTKVGLGTTSVEVMIWPLVLVEREIEVMEAGTESDTVRLSVIVLEGAFLAKHN